MSAVFRLIAAAAAFVAGHWILVQTALFYFIALGDRKPNLPREVKQRRRSSRIK